MTRTGTRFAGLLAYNALALGLLVGANMAGFAQTTSTTGSGTTGTTGSGTTHSTGSGTSIPEPASIALLITAASALSFVHGRRGTKAASQNERHGGDR
ncbi:MAG: PEP-CTERM sorting domain-containing protein [Acetobacteraceae bacterium]